MKLNGSDTVNKWNAYDRNVAAKHHEGVTKLPSLWKFNPISEKQIMNGTFTDADPKNKHMYIPELELAVANMDGFFSNYYIEPFIRVFNTLGLDDDEVDKMLDAPWDSKPNKRIVMRTAAFGHGRSGLSMCIKEGGMRESLGFKGSKGVLDEMLVPFAIISAMRKRVSEVGIRSITETK